MKKIYVPYIILLITQVIFAIACGPHSCEWGNSLYFYAGIACATVSLALPFFQKKWPLEKRVAYSLLYLLISVTMWIAGFMLFGFRIMCRLF
jgi:hypothetical protein